MSEAHPTPSQVLQVNLELVKTLRSILHLAERGRIGSLAIVGALTTGEQIQSLQVQDMHVPMLNTGCDCIKAKLIGRMLMLEKAGQVSPIERATVLPNG